MIIKNLESCSINRDKHRQSQQDHLRINIVPNQTIISGKDGATKLDEFLEKFQAAFDPPPSFSKNYVAIFL